MHVPAEFGGRAIKNLVDHFRNLGSTLECAIEHVVINAVLGEQFRERASVVLFDSIAEGAEQSGGVHRRSSLAFVMPRAGGGIQYSRAVEINRVAAAYCIVRRSLSSGCRSADPLVDD